MSSPSAPVDGVLLLYHRPLLIGEASTLTEHIEAFRKHSRFPVWCVNTEEQFPVGLDDLRFKAIVLHYSLFGGAGYHLGPRFLDYLDRSIDAYKIAFFQDEHQHCRGRFAFIDRHRLDCIYTLVEPAQLDATYRAHTKVDKLVTTIPGYASDSLREAARRFARADAARTIDIGYRARPLAFFMGRGAQEKVGIAQGFVERARGRGLRLDIASGEEDRLYGADWHRFLGNCRGALGVEAGVSVFDLEDQAHDGCDRFLAANPGADFETVHREVLAPYEDRVFYRTISPRHFEAAAFRVCQILFEGRYSGILEPMVHYLPLRKDFSNFDEILRLFGDPAVRRELTDNAHRDLIASGDHDDRRFVETFDRDLVASGLRTDVATDRARVTRALARGATLRKLRAGVTGLRHVGGRLRDRLRR